MMTLSQYLDAKKLTQAEFARLLGVNQGTVSKLCTGKKPSWGMATRIAAATGNDVPVQVWATQSERAA
jgi:transcriptional regulator with XRE-family HTH domain